MRYLVLIVIAFFIIILSGCSTKEEAIVKDMFIADLKNIDLAQVDYAPESSKQTTDRKKIADIYNNIYDLSLEKLNTDKEASLIKNNKVIYSIVFTSAKKVVGSVFIFSNGDVYIPDISAMGNNKRTPAYIHYSLDEQRLKYLISVFKSLE